MIIIPIAIVWCYSVFDLVWRRHDMRWWQRLLWLVVVVIIPVVGGCVYAAIATSRRGPVGDNDDLSYADLDHLHARGVISDADYARHVNQLGAYSGGG
jgi:Phospholipase_D-nuclease N-terminal